jgi:integrase
MIARLPAPDPSGKPVLHWDGELKGFAVLCSGVSNAKTYVVQRDLPGGKARRVTIGAVAEISLATARERAADKLDDLRRGIDPKRKVANPTLASALADYLAARKDLRPASVRVYRQVEKYLAAWLDWPLRDLTAERVEQRHRALADEVGPITANTTMRTLRVLWNFAEERTPDFPTKSPVRLRRQWYAEPRRERIVNTDQLPAFYAAVQVLPPIARDFTLLMLFTGMRRSEAASLQWADIDLTERVLRVPATRTKNKRALALPMSDVVRDLLVARRALGKDNSGYVFPSSHGGHIHSAHGQRHFDTIAEETGIRVSAHDLRRTFITVAESTDISLLALKALVNHSMGKDVTSGYVMMNVERLRVPAQKVADRLKELCGISPVDGRNISRLR